MSGRKHKWKRKINMDKPLLNITNTHVCVQCGLGKGNIKQNFHFHELVYFTPEKILSSGRVPFSCVDEWIGGDLLINNNDVVFICEDEFKV